MALINCPECGKEISDKATACIHCGFPLSELRGEQNKDEENKGSKGYLDPGKKYRVVLKSMGENESSTKNAIENLGKNYDKAKGNLPFVLRHTCSAEDAESIISTFKDIGCVVIAEEANSHRYEPEEPSCPKCGSTSIQIVKKGFSVGKAAAGTLLIGPIGLVGGAIGSNKTMRVCLNCNHKW